ncbi:MAG: PD-(D/E)XK nuclease family protein [Anaerolineae bacterium]|nr:PD-(D/E)XK nuclease family protein [Anaerolineae bacterium]
MVASLYVAPAGAGKTAYVLELARSAARGLSEIPRVIVPDPLQARAWRRRLAQAGGSIGVRVLTFDQLYAECLSLAGEVYTELSEPVQYRLMRAIVGDLALVHYAPLTDRPGFVQVLQRLIGELKAARVWPEVFADAVRSMGGEPRLQELAWLYQTYQGRVQAQGWADRAGMGWLAVESLTERALDVGRQWPLLVVDGFGDYTPVQLALLQVLACRVGEVIVTATGDGGGSERPLVHRRFSNTRVELERVLRVRAAPLPERTSFRAPALAHLEVNLLNSAASRVEAGTSVELIEAPDRAGEVRAALRWLKARLVLDEMRPGEVALLARSITPYRPFIVQTAAEFGLPLRLVDGLPLRSNPAVASILDLLRLALPGAEDDPSPSLPRRLVIEAWRSPYFDWSALPDEGAAEPIGIVPEDADRLDALARAGRVIGGMAQWEEAFRDTCAPDQGDAGQGEAGPEPGHRSSAAYDEERGPAEGVLVGSEAERLRGMFHRFVRRLVPPSGECAHRDFVRWLETLIGSDVGLGHSRLLARADGDAETTSLRIVDRVRSAGGEVEQRDLAALRALKDGLRGLVWAEEALGTPAADYARFFGELVGAVDASTYRMPVRADRDEIAVVEVAGARGVSFRAVAVLGMAEGEFPATLREDAFLRDADRQRLREEFGLRLEPSVESAEAEFFYEAITRPSERLLLTRPRLADNGALWQASPFWEEVRRLVDARPVRLSGESVPDPTYASSWPELMESLAVHPGFDTVCEWADQANPFRRLALDLATRVLLQRQERAPGSVYDGDLSDVADALACRFGPDHVWSPSRLESYQTCPFLFFIQHALGLESREEPVEGLASRQLGNIYHRILEEVYQSAAVRDPADVEQLLAALPSVSEQILDGAPQQEGFRETAWWAQTRAEITHNVSRSLQALAGEQGDFVPHQYEAIFGLRGAAPLLVSHRDQQFRLRGLIDRIDRKPDGRLRIIDYKTSSPSAYTAQQVAQGKKLQLPLYALAARDALELGEPEDGFYWHVRHAEASSFRLSTFDGGAAGAMETAKDSALQAVCGARAGRFIPSVPESGCPGYCPAAGFCWQYRSGYGG